MSNTSCLSIKRRTGFVIIALFSGMAAAKSQNAQSSPVAVAPPTPPLVATAATGMEWTIEYSAPKQSGASNAEAGSAYLKSKKVSKAENLRREVSTWSDGSQSEDWLVDDVLIHREPSWAPNYLVAQKTRGEKTKAKGRQPKTNADGNVSATMSDLDDDFQMPWLAIDYYKEISVLVGKECHLYEAPNSIVFPGDRLSDAVKAQVNDPNVPKDIRELIETQLGNEKKGASNFTRVWIDAKTRLPVAIETGGVTGRFSYAKGPNTLVLPPAYAKEYEVYRQLYPEK